MFLNVHLERINLKGNKFPSSARKKRLCAGPKIVGQKKEKEDSGTLHREAVLG